MHKNFGIFFFQSEKKHLHQTNAVNKRAVRHIVR